MDSEVIAIGDEITSGQLLDTNSQWLSLRLEELGIRVLYHAAVGDEMDALAGVFRRALARADVVVVTGGIGPTADDLTRDALAQATGRPLVLDPQALDHIRGLFARRKRPMPEQNECQAMFPEGSRVVPNPHGTAPGIDLEWPREGRGPCRLFALPGVPAEMKEMWEETVAGRLRSWGAGGRTVRHRRIKCFGAGESHIEAMLPDLIRRGRVPRVGINASQATIILRITAEGATEEECRAATEPTAATIYEKLGTLVYGEEDEELQDVVLRRLGQRNQTLATAEWGTAGLIAQWLGSVGQVSNLSRVGQVSNLSPVSNLSQSPFLGGLTLTGQSLRLGLDIPPDLSEDRLAAGMAEACRQKFGSDYGLAVGPFPAFDPAATEPKPVHFGLAGPGGTKVKTMPFAAHPALLTVYCAKQALNLLRLTMLDEG